MTAGWMPPGGRILAGLVLALLLAAAAGCSQPTGQATVTAVSSPTVTSEPGEGAGGTGATSAPSTTGSTTAPSSSRAVAADSPNGSAAPIGLADLLATMNDVHGPTDDLVGQLNRLGYFNPSVPVPPGTLDVLTVATTAEMSFLPSSRRLVSSTRVQVHTTSPVATIEAFYAAGALGDGWEFSLSQPTRGNNLMTTYNSTAVGGLSFDWWIDADASAQRGGTVLNLSSSAARPLDAPELTRLAGWSPDGPPAGSGELSEVEVGSTLSSLGSTEATLQTTYTFPGAEGPAIVGQVADRLGSKGEETDPTGDDLWVQWDRPPLAGLSGYQLRVSELKDKPGLQYDPHLVIVGSAPLPLG